MNNDLRLIEAWRERGPVAWAESQWIDVTGQPVRLTDWQRAVLSAWWDNREDVTTLAISNVKKTGKTFINAVLLCWRWLALPGQHFASGNDFEQSQARQFKEIAQMVERNDYLRENVKAGRSELLFIPTGSTLTALAADATGNSGANFITTSHTETWGVEHEASIRSFEELTPIPGTFSGLPCLRICDSYAGMIGESKTWQGIVDNGLLGKKVGKSIYKNGQVLLFHMTGKDAREKCFRGTPAEAKRYYTEQHRTLRPNTFTRFHANEQTTGESAFLPQGAWEKCYSPDVRPLMPTDKRKVVLGADASTSHDFTSLVGMAGGDAIFVRTWKPVKIAGIRMGKPTIDIDATITQEVLNLHKRGQVEAVVCDPYQLATSIVKWEKAGIRVIELAQNSGRVEADQSLYDDIVSGQIRHCNNPELNEAVNNAVALETPRGIRLAKEKTSKKIDACVALSMAHYAAVIKFVPDVSGSIDDWEGYVYEHEHCNRNPHPEGITWENCPHRMTRLFCM